MAQAADGARIAAEYRRLPGLSPGHESPELRLAIRKMSNRRETMVELFNPAPIVRLDRLGSLP